MRLTQLPDGGRQEGQQFSSLLEKVRWRHLQVATVYGYVALNARLGLEQLKLK